MAVWSKYNYLILQLLKIKIMRYGIQGIQDY